MAAVDGRGLRVGVLRLGALAEQRRQGDGDEDAEDQDDDEQLDEARSRRRRGDVGASMSPVDRPGDDGALARVSAGWPSRAGRLRVARGVEAPGAVAPRAAHAVRLAAEAGDQLAAAAAGGAGAGIVLHGACRVLRSPAGPPSRRACCGLLAIVGSAGWSVGQRAAHRRRHLAVRERAQQAVGAERGLGVGRLGGAEQDAGDGRRAERRAGGERLERLAAPSSGLSCSAVSGLVNSSAPVGRGVLVAQDRSAPSRRCSSTASPRCPARAARRRSR